MKKSIALFLCLVLLVSTCLSGCFFEKNKLLGTWTTTVDLADMVNEEMEKSDPAVAKFVKVKELNVTFNLTFHDDDTYTMKVDQEKLDEALKDMMAGMVDGLMLYLEDMLNLEQWGLDMELDQVLEMLNIDLDSLLAEAYDSLVAEDIFADLDTSGYYYAKDGKLYTGDSYDAAKSEMGVYERYSLKDGVLTINEGTLENELAEYIYPMVFEKVG